MTSGMLKFKLGFIQKKPRPFFINHNVFISQNPNMTVSLDRVFEEINNNTGNAYIAYALGRFMDLSRLSGGIGNAWTFFLLQIGKVT
jgi:hypothetical protein